MDTFGTTRTPRVLRRKAVDGDGVARYSVQFAPSAGRDLAALDKPVQRRVAARIDALAENPRPAGVTKLQGEANAWRIRVGDYRILYTIEDRRLVVLVIKIGHRREVYR
jgi:mRNA interferase RelE/StbE